MLTGVTETSIEQLHDAVWALKKQGNRFVTMTCCDLGDAHDLLYHFDKNYQLAHLRVRVPRGTVLPSISDVFFAAVLVENEIKDMFGVPFSGLAIDYQGRFMLSEDAPQTPLNKNCGMSIDLRVKAPAVPAGSAKS